MQLNGKMQKSMRMAKAFYKAKRLENYNTLVALLTLSLYQKMDSRFRLEAGRPRRNFKTRQFYTPNSTCIKETHQRAKGGNN